tara:strand:+ start:350 stop:460 length:111 start_codon:yes stop_codon:yes gene_type:complete
MVNHRREEKMIGLFFIGVVVSIIVMGILIYVRKYDS